MSFNKILSYDTIRTVFRLSPGEEIKKLLHGGSSASIAVISDSSGKVFVRKTSDSPEKNGAPHVALEAKFYSEFLPLSPLLSGIFPGYLNSSYDAERPSATLDLNYIPGDTLPDLLALKNPDDISKICNALGVLFFTLFSEGYSASFIYQNVQLTGKKATPEEGQDHFKRLYKKRILERFEHMKNTPSLNCLLEGSLSLTYKTLLEKPCFLINNERHLNPFILFLMLLKLPLFQPYCQVSYLAVPVHQDINPGNVIATPSDSGDTYFLTTFDSHSELLRQTDSQCIVANYQDLLMDPAKILFGFLGFSDIIKSNFSVSLQNDTDLSFDFKITENRSSQVMYQSFLTFMSTDPSFEKYRTHEPDFIFKAQLVAALQFLGDMIYRVESLDLFLADFLQGTVALNTLIRTQFPKLYDTFLSMYLPTAVSEDPPLSGSIFSQPHLQDSSVPVI